MKSKLHASILGLLLLAPIALGQVSSYTPPSIQSISSISPTGGSGGATLTISVTVVVGTDKSPSVVLGYSGAGSTKNYSSFAPSSGSTYTVNIPITSESIIGTYQLSTITLMHTEGFMVYSRDGKASDPLSIDPPGSHTFNFSAGDFAVVAPGGNLPPTVPSGSPLTGRAVALSTRSSVGAGDNVLIVGMVVSGGAKEYLVRAVGPTLVDLGVPGALPDPKLTVIPIGKTEAIASNDNWGGTSALRDTFARLGAQALPNDSKDAALVIRLEPGVYTFVVSSADTRTGIALVEAYEIP